MIATTTDRGIPVAWAGRAVSAAFWIGVLAGAVAVCLALVVAQALTGSLPYVRVQQEFRHLDTERPDQSIDSNLAFDLTSLSNLQGEEPTGL